MMKLGILVNTDKHPGDVVGITKAALAKGHGVTIFLMDGGNFLLSNADVSGLCNEEGISMSFCDHSAQKLGIDKEGIPDKISAGSQFDNANMIAEVDRVIVL
jgi:predicted peroxiredoxin